jgi:hypothetical protein
MKVSVSKKDDTISGIRAEELQTIMYLLGNIRERCFRAGPEENGEYYYSGDDFLAVLKQRELDDFYSFVNNFWNSHDAMREKFFKGNDKNE